MNPARSPSADLSSDARDRAGRFARLRSGLRVLAWTAPLALLLAVPLGPDVAARSLSQSASEAAPEPEADAGGTFESMMVARPMAFLSHQRELSYPFEQVWPTAVRYLKVDRKFKVTEKDEDAGYILFEFPHGPSATGAGSMELLATEDASGRDAVRVMISTSNGPAHLPHSLGEGLKAKIKAERGQPAPPPPSDPPAQEPPDEDEQEDDQSWILHPNGDQ